MPFNGKFVAQIVDQVAKRGVSYEDLISILGVSPNELVSDSTEIDYNSFNRMFEVALNGSKDNILGIHISQSMNLHAAGLIMQLAQSSATFKEAIQFACEYAMLGCQSLPMRLEETEYAYELVYGFDRRWRLNSEDAYQHVLEGAIYFLLKQYETLTGKKFSPIKVTLDYQPRTAFKELQSWYGCQVFIRDARSSVVFRKADLDTPVQSADYSLLQHLLQFANLRLDNLQKRNTPVQQVSRIIINTLPDRARVEDVARELNMGVRTLQRRLKYEDTSFRELLEDHLLDFARENIRKQAKPNLSEIAYLLNYSDLSAFSRAYRKHFGVPPTKEKAIA